MICNITTCMKGEFCLSPPCNGGAQNPCTGHSPSLTMEPIPKLPIEAYSKSPEVKPCSKSKYREIHYNIGQQKKMGFNRLNPAQKATDFLKKSKVGQK